MCAATAPPCAATNIFIPRKLGRRNLNLQSINTEIGDVVTLYLNEEMLLPKAQECSSVLGELP